MQRDLSHTLDMDSSRRAELQEQPTLKLRTQVFSEGDSALPANEGGSTVAIKFPSRQDAAATATERGIVFTVGWVSFAADPDHKD